MPPHRKKEWFDDESMWRDGFPILFPPQRIAIADESMRKALKLVGLRRGAALDLCCGPGRCSIALAKRGFSVTGVDRTKYLLDKARAAAKAAHVTVEWIQQDMRDFVRPEAFDFALSMFTSFGYFENRKQDADVLRNILLSLRRGGKFLIDVMGKEVLAAKPVDTFSDTLPDGSTLFDKPRIVDDWSRVVTEWTIVRKGRARRLSFQVNLYSAQELKDLMERTGFVDVRCFGNLNGDPYGRGASRLVGIGKKP